MLDINPNFITGYTRSSAAAKNEAVPSGTAEPQGQLPARGSITVPQVNILTAQFFKDMKLARSCFGGKLFRSKNNYGNPVLVFAVADHDPETDMKHRGWYNAISSYAKLGFCPYDRSYKAKTYTFYTFSIPGNVMSLRELMENPENHSKGVAIFKLLVRFLRSYRDNYPHNGNYIPLCCLSLDTVFFSTGGSDHRPHILPLKAVRNHYPEYYPGEVCGPHADLSTDLYTAALVATQLLSGQESEGLDGKAMYSDDATVSIRQCLAPFRTWRPTLGDLLQELKLSEPGEGDPGKRSPRPFRDASGNYVSKPHTDKKEGGFSGWITGIQKAFSGGIAEPSEHKKQTLTRIHAGDIDPAKSRRSIEAEEQIDDYDADDYGGFDD